MTSNLNPLTDIRPLPPFPVARPKSSVTGVLPFTTEPPTWTDFAPLIAFLAATRISSGDLAATPLLDAPPHPAIVAAAAETARIANNVPSRLDTPGHNKPNPCAALKNITNAPLIQSPIARPAALTPSDDISFTPR